MIHIYTSFQTNVLANTVNDFDKFKNKYQNAKNCKYVEAPTYNAIEIKTDNTLAYVMDIPTSEYYKTKS